MRIFNVYSPLIVVYPGETFQWELDAGEPSPVTVTSSGDSNWPLTETLYTVTDGPTPSTASVYTAPNLPPGPTPDASSFYCTPAAANVIEQQIIVANGPFDVCSDVNVNPGEYFIWKNDTGIAVTIAPDPGNEDFWPLESQSHEVPAGDCLAVQVPSTAVLGTSYTLNVSGCPQATQPKLYVGSPGAR